VEGITLSLFAFNDNGRRRRNPQSFLIESLTKSFCLHSILEFPKHPLAMKAKANNNDVSLIIEWRRQTNGFLSLVISSLMAEEEEEGNGCGNETI